MIVQCSPMSINMNYSVCPSIQMSCIHNSFLKDELKLMKHSCSIRPEDVHYGE